MRNNSSRIASLGILGGVGLLALLGGQGAPLAPDIYQASDPRKFTINWEMVGEVLLMVIVLAFLVERALALLFESRWFIEIEKRREAAQQGSYKPLIAFAVSAAGCVMWQFDALSIILLRDTWTVLGAMITGGVVAGGSKAAVKLFHDVLEVKSGAQAEKDKLDEAKNAQASQPVAPVIMVPTVTSPAAPLAAAPTSTPTIPPAAEGV